VYAKQRHETWTPDNASVRRTYLLIWPSHEQGTYGDLEVSQGLGRKTPTKLVGLRWQGQQWSAKLKSVDHIWRIACETFRHLLRIDKRWKWYHRSVGVVI
jgi:hypothetical protein